MSYRSKIHVQYQDGSKPKGAKVVLSFSGLMSGGVTRDVYTDSNGTAIVEHPSKGTAKVIVNGREVGKIQAPDETVVFI